MRRWPALLLAASLAVAGCGTDDEAPATVPASSETTAPPEVVAVGVERSRLFEQQRSLAVTVRNSGPDPVVVDEVRFAAGRYEEVPAADRTVTVPAAGQVSFPVPYGPARCDAEEDEVVVHLAIDGEATTRTAPVSGQVRRAHERECAAAAVRRAVRVEFADDWEVVAPRRVQGSLDVTPLAGHEVEVADVATSIVFVTETTAADTRRTSLDVVAARCDTHALIESKKTFTFTLSVVVDGEAPVALEIVPEDGPAREALQQAVEDCLADGPAA